MGRMGALSADGTGVIELPPYVDPETGVEDPPVVMCTQEYREGYTRGPNCEWIPIHTATPPVTGNTPFWYLTHGQVDPGNPIFYATAVATPPGTNQNTPSPAPGANSKIPWWVWLLVGVGGVMVMKKS